MSTTVDIWSEDSSAGPPSKGIDIRAFLVQSEQANLEAATSSLQARWQGLEVDASTTVENSCSLADLRLRMDGILSNPRRRLLFNNENLKTLRTILCTSPTVAETECLAWAHKVSLEQNGAPVGQPIQDDGLDNLLPRQGKVLRSWKAPGSAVYFVGRPSAHFTNTLADIKTSAASTLPLQDGKVLVTVSVYKCNIARWSPLVLHSRHVFASTHTLKDLADTLGCCCNDVPSEELPGFGACIAGFGLVKPTLVPSSPSMHHDDPKDIFAFGNPSTTMDCAAKYSQFAQSLDEGNTGWPPQTCFEASLPISEAAFSSLLLQLNKPYLFIHQGNCQHPFTIDEIRLRQRYDPPISGLPVTTFASWVPGVTCKICLKMPATVSLVDNPQLGESPALICDGCQVKLYS